MSKIRELAAELIRQENEKGNGLSPNYLAMEWARRNGGRDYGSSRRRFGYTSAAYRTLRAMSEAGLARQVITRTAGGYPVETYYSPE